MLNEDILMVRTEKFIEKAKLVHGDKYIYEKTEYVKSCLKVTITCPKHGDFEQLPSNHIQGNNCPKCGLEERSLKRISNTNAFIEKAKKIHGEKYDYSKVEYLSSHDKVTIICKKHGSFDQPPSRHLSNKGCPKCGIESHPKRPFNTKEMFIERAKKIHGDKYDYSKVVYTGSAKKVVITCPAHGDFSQTPNNHLSNRGCPKCVNAKISKKLNKGTDGFLERAKEVHRSKYNYDKVEYVNCSTSVTITCKTHGDFKQLPYVHLSGKGCRKCEKLREGLF